MQAWQEFIKAQRKELGHEIVERWLEPLTITRFDACNLYLQAHDSFAALWFEEHIRPKLKKFVNNNSKLIKVHLSLGDNLQIPARKAAAKTAWQETIAWTFDSLNPQLTFASYLTTQDNLLAHKLLQESASPKADATMLFNPIYIFGRKGTGKTHLLMAYCDAMKKEGRNAAYVHAQTFTEHVVRAIRNGQMHSFRKCYRHLDALVIDEIETFAKKGATQEEFFHTFNTLHSEGKQLVIAASSPPKELKFIEMRLTSRFEWGIVIPLKILEKTEMQNALLMRAGLLNFPLQKEIVDLLLHCFSSNMKSLMRALEALILRSHLHESKLTVANARMLLTDLMAQEENAALTAVKIIRALAEHYGIKIEDILGKAQSREATLPRQLAMYLCRSLLKLPYMKIGDIFSRDHSTVISSVRLIEKTLAEKKSELASELNALIRRLENS